MADYEKIKQKEKEQQATLHESPSKIACEVCDKLFFTHTQKHIHSYKEHGIAVPQHRLDIMSVTDNVEVFRALQQKEKEFRIIYGTKLGRVEATSELTLKEKRMLSSHDFVLSSEGLLYCMDVATTRSRSRVRLQLRLAIPKLERKRIMQQAHDTKLRAHPGITIMMETLRQSVWWPSMIQDIVDYVAKCVVCQRGKGDRSSVPVQPMGVPVGPWTHVSVDHVGPLPITANGNEYILVAIDRFTRWVELMAVTDTSTTTTSDCIVKYVVCRHGVMEVLGSDRGSGFVSQLAGEIYAMLGIKRIKTTAYHPQSNGVVEIFNKTLKTSLKLWANENQNDWDELLPFVAFAYHTTYHTGIQEVPFYLNHGRTARVTTNDITDRLSQTTWSVHAYAADLAAKLSKTHERVTEIMKQVNENRLEEDAIKLPTYEIGEKVLLFDVTTPKGLSRKLVNRWKGPYIIISKQSEVNYTIIKEGKPQLVNVHRLRHYKENESFTHDEQYEEQLSLAQNEIEAISQEMNSLADRKEALERQSDKIEASQAVSSLDDTIGSVNACIIQSERSLKWHK